MIRVLIADDEALVRSGLRLILESSGGISVIAEARDGAEAVGSAIRLRPDIVLMDVRMPGTDGLAAAAQLTALPDPPRIIMLTTFDADEYIHQALRLGAVGFLLKDIPPRDLIAAIHTVADDNAILSPAVTKKLLTSFTTRPPSTAARRRLARLTPRETDVIRSLAQGQSNAEIARRLSLTEPTVKAHVSHILDKLALTNRVQAALLVHDANLRWPPSNWHIPPN
ncbi:DNA-binding response regulator [Acrocarpospora corrugata]|uniref:DNA-binding response regulator n=1 Tax=Acrocarpospora corrugata TaxID=35763 RepID=A0A5M3WFI3_9ACTN|nr:response regulator transcription factor [Acrocarpospora corrugata]GES05903.1 DNA-binding response regulator [Acrocarpospora corrugata]